MPKIFLGKGWGFPVAAGADGTLRLAEYEERVRQSIWIILGTAKGERVMRPDFGCGIYDLVFSPNTPDTAGKVAQAVRQALLVVRAAHQRARRAREGRGRRLGAAHRGRLPGARD